MGKLLLILQSSKTALILVINKCCNSLFRTANLKIFQKK